MSMFDVGPCGPESKLIPNPEHVQGFKEFLLKMMFGGSRCSSVVECVPQGSRFDP